MTRERDGIRRAAGAAPAADGWICGIGLKDGYDDVDWADAWRRAPRAAVRAIVDLSADFYADAGDHHKGSLGGYYISGALANAYAGADEAMERTTGRKREIIRRWRDRAARRCEGPGDAWRAWLGKRRAFLDWAQDVLDGDAHV